MSTTPPPPPPSTAPLLCVCAWCGRWRDEAGRWVDDGTTPQPAGRRVTHGICPVCEATQAAEETVQ